MKSVKYIAAALLLVSVISCKPKPKSDLVPIVGFVDAFEDATIAQARTGFTDALKKNGFSEDKKTVQIEYRTCNGNSASKH